MDLKVTLIRHQVFEDRVKTALVRAGLPIAVTFDASLSWGVYLEVADDEKLPPELFLKWRVHPVLQEHFRGVGRKQLQSDDQVREMRNVERSMNDAIIAILEFSGFMARVIQGERVGEILVGESNVS